MERFRLRCIFLLLVYTTAQYETVSGADLKMDEALLTVQNQMSYGLHVLYTSDYCYKCLYQPLATLTARQGNVSVVVNTHFALTLKVSTMNDNSTYMCSMRYLFEEAGHYSLWVRPEESDLGLNVTCFMSVNKIPNNTYLPLLVAVLVLVLLACLWASVPFLSKCRCTSKLLNLICCHKQQSTEQDEETVTQNQVRLKSSRLKSLDTFRGM